MAIGTVKFFNTQKGFGFIQPDDGSKDVFVHVSALERAGMSTLNEGQKVSYEVVTERGKQAAGNLQARLETLDEHAAAPVDRIDCQPVPGDEFPHFLRELRIDALDVAFSGDDPAYLGQDLPFVGGALGLGEELAVFGRRAKVGRHLFREHGVARPVYVVRP